MATLKIASHDSSKFTFSPETRAFVAEASDFGRALPFCRLYDDACDVGLAIRSARTGTVIRYALNEEQRCADGDVVAWHLIPIFEDERRVDGTSVTILND